MKRRPPIVLILLLLVAGAIVNVAVAWGFVFWARPTSGMELERSAVEAILNADGFAVAPEDRCEGGASDGEGFQIQNLLLDAMDRGGASTWTTMFVAGWPRSSLRGGWRSAGTTTDELYNFKPFNGITSEKLKIEGESFDRLFPLRPIWPGFAINTVFYAFILWLLFALGGTPFALRRRRRIKRGLCPKCGYDLRGTPAHSTPCPECGAV